jgi:hypothetical protein
LLRHPRVRAGAVVSRLSSALLAAVVAACSVGDGLVPPGAPISIAIRTAFDEDGPLPAATPFRLDRARVLALRPSSGEVLADVETPIAVGQTSVSMDLSVELATTREQLRIRVELFSGDILAYAGEALMFVDAGTRVNESPPITLELAAPSLDVGSESLAFALRSGGGGATQSLEVANHGAGALAWQASSDAPWLTLSPPSGSIAEDGTALIQAEASAAGLESGIHSGTVTVDAPGALGSPWTLTVTLVVEPNQPPTAQAGPDRTVADADTSGDETVPLDGSASSDADGSIVAWSWTEEGEEIATGATPTVTLAVGTHVITLTVTDDSGSSASDDVQVTVLAQEKRPPVASAGADRAVTDEDETGEEPVLLDGSGSSDPDGAIVSWVWSESGEAIATGATATVSLAVGTHLITLTVTDDDGASASDQVLVTVLATRNQAPVADAGPDQTVVDGDGSGDEAVALDATASTDPDGSIVSWVWSEGSTTLASGAEPTVGLTDGTHRITLTVTDDVGASATDDVVVRVLPPSYATLTVVVDGVGSVGSSGVTPAIACDGGTCSQAYPLGTEVTLTATQVDPDYTFERWLGTGDGFTCATDATCTVTVDGDRTLTAWFPAPAQVSVSPGTATFTMIQGGSPSPASEAITVTNTGERSATDLVAGTTYAPEVPAWLSATLDGTVVDTLAPRTLTLAVDPNDLDPGSYQATVSVGNASTGDQVEVTLTVTSAAPVISNLAVELVQVNDTLTCSDQGSRYLVSFDFSDPDGDVTEGLATIRDAYLSDSDQSGTWTWPGAGDYTVGGDGFSGSVGLVLCTRFDNATSVEDAFTLEDGAGHVSNTLSTTSNRPTGANAPGVGFAGVGSAPPFAPGPARQRAISRWTPKR